LELSNEIVANPIGCFLLSIIRPEMLVAASN